MSRPSNTKPLFRDLLAVLMVTLFASGGAFTLGVLVPRVEQQSAAPASSTPPPPAGEREFIV